MVNRSRTKDKKIKEETNFKNETTDTTKAISTESTEFEMTTTSTPKEAKQAPDLKETTITNNETTTSKTQIDINEFQINDIVW